MEGESADRFRKNFGTADWLKVPGIFWERTTSEVLTMEYCPGVKINKVAELDKMGVDRKRLAKLAVESYLQQILTHGFFHAGRKPSSASYSIIVLSHRWALSSLFILSKGVLDKDFLKLWAILIIFSR